MTDEKTRPDRALRSLDAGAEISPERTAEILRERARALARPPVEADAAVNHIEVVTFQLGKERYAIEARYVLGITRAVGVTPVPGLPDFFVGVTNLRGDILAVVDLVRFLRVEGAEGGERSRLIVLGTDKPEFGILADDAEQVVKIDEATLHPPSTVLGGIRHPHLRGITEDALIALDGEALLADETLFFDEGEESGHSAKRTAK